MTTIGWLGLVAAVVLAAVDWLAVATARLSLERIAKPAVIVALAVVVLAADSIEPSLRFLVTLALAASLMGDLLLLTPGRLLAGLAAFLVAQLAYAAAFATGPLEPGWLLAGAAIALLVAVVVGRPILAAARRTGLGSAVAVYLVAILVMATLATGSRIVMAALGAWLFVASDALLAWGIFVDPQAPGQSEDGRSRVAVIVTYHAAQVLLVLSLVA